MKSRSSHAKRRLPSGSGTPANPSKRTRKPPRLAKLLADPLATVLDPQGNYVICNRCDTQIKLSEKSKSDTYHWTRHRDQYCLKKSQTVTKKQREDSVKISHEPTPSLVTDARSPSPIMDAPSTPIGSEFSEFTAQKNLCPYSYSPEVSWCGPQFQFPESFERGT